MTQEALKLALEALDNLMYWDNGKPDYDEAREAITAIKEALTLPDPYKQGYADAMNWKVQNHLEHLPTAQPEQEPVKYSDYESDGVHHNKPAQPEQEPVAWRVRWPKMGGGYAWVMNDAPLMAEHGFVNEPLYTTPPQEQQSCDKRTWERPWVSLTDEEIEDAWRKVETDDFYDCVQPFAKAIEAKLKEKNTHEAI